MACEPTRGDLVDEAAAEPKVVRGDQGTFEAHPIPDLIAAENRKATREALEAAAAAGRPRIESLYSRFRPGSALR